MPPFLYNQVINDSGVWGKNEGSYKGILSIS